jgi:hypothetical protein
MRKAIKLSLIAVLALIVACLSFQPASARGPMVGVLGYFPEISLSKPFSDYAAIDSISGLQASTEEAGAPTGPKNHMQFELYTGMPRSISYWKPVNGLIEEKIGEEPGIVAMRLTGLMVGGRRVDMAGRVFL